MGVTPCMIGVAMKFNNDEEREEYINDCVEDFLTLMFIDEDLDEETYMEIVRRDWETLEYIPQTPNICIEAIRNGLDNRDMIDIDWTPEMEREWVLSHV